MTPTTVLTRLRKMKGNSMIIYNVQNKVSNALFVSKKDAENYLGQVGSATNGLQIYELYVIDAIEEDEGERHEKNS